MKQAIVIRHVAFEDLGSFTEILQNQDYAISYMEAGSDDLSTIKANDPDLVIILGGPIGAYDEQDYPFLHDEFRLLERRLSNDRPTLGICLGAQLMSRVLGAKVYPGTHGKEIGWAPITLSAVGEQSALRHLIVDDMPVLHWHGDTFDIPADCVHLAGSSQYQNQAFSHKRCGLAMQFHPEVTTKGMERWFIGHTCEIGNTPDVSVSNLRQDTAQYSQRLEKQAQLFFQEWLEVVSLTAVA